LSPWWLRPTSEGAEEPTPETEQSPSPDAPEAPVEAEAAPTPASHSHYAEPQPVQQGPFGPADALPEPLADDDEDEEGWLASGESDADAESEGEGEGDDDAEGDEPNGNGVTGATTSFGETAERPGRRKRRRRGGRGGRGGDKAVAEAVGVEAGAAVAAAPEVRAERRPEPVRAKRPEIAELPPVDFQSLSAPREIYVPMPERAHRDDERKIALFCDLENIALGVRDSEVKKFDIDLVLERLLEKGKIIVKKAYCDWERYSDYKRTFHEAAIELIDIPQKYYSGKNSADIKMVVDAMDLSYSKEHLDTFVLLSGDSDFSPLVSKLKENNKYVIGVGVKNSSSNLLIDNCDEFLYYEDIWRDQNSGPSSLEGLGKKHAEVFSLMIDSIGALMRENKDVLWGSMIKQTMQRKKPSFNEGYYGYSTFSELLQDAERKGIVKLRKDQRSGTYVVTGFASQK
jgi:uncharacterized protein (TIGR00288 family)